jgi:hypothetical protein
LVIAVAAGGATKPLFTPVIKPFFGVTFHSVGLIFLGAPMGRRPVILLLHAVLCIALADCSTNKIVDHPDQRRQAEANVGKTYWLTSPTLFMCQTPGSQRCDFAPKNQPLKIDDVTDGEFGVHYHVLFGDGKAGYLRRSEFDSYATAADPVADASK